MLWWKLQRLKSGDVQTRRRVVRELSGSCDPRAMPALMASLVDESFLVRKEAAQSLGEVGDERALKPLINLIEDSLHYSMAKTAAFALETLLVRVAVNAVSKDVQAAAALNDISGGYPECLKRSASASGARIATTWTMDCSRVRRLANQELTRRGLPAE